MVEERIRSTKVSCCFHFITHRIDLNILRRKILQTTDKSIAETMINERWIPPPDNTVADVMVFRLSVAQISGIEAAVLVELFRVFYAHGITFRSPHVEPQPSGQILSCINDEALFPFLYRHAGRIIALSLHIGQHLRAQGSVGNGGTLRLLPCAVVITRHGPAF